MEDTILEVKGICKRFGGVLALNDVNLQITRGEVHALVGENGAGKSTLIKILTGATEPSSGTIVFEGNEYTEFTPVKSSELGITAIYQEFNLIPFLSVVENIYFGCERLKNGLLDKKMMQEECQRLFNEIGIDIDPKEKVKNLGIAQQQLVEIAKAISKNAKLIIMDEPTAPLTDRETETLHRLVRQFKEKGITIIYISHRMEEIFDICDRVSVLRDGHWISTGRVSDTNRSKLIADMVGRSLGESYPRSSEKHVEIVLEVKGLTNSRIENVSFSLKRGEILGIGGLVGAGRTEVVRAIFGADNLYNGEIIKDGKEIIIKTPQDALKHNIALLPEDRKTQGVVMNLSIRDNISLCILERLSRFSILNAAKEKALCERLVADLKIKISSLRQAVQNLSGGNQQKVVLAKCLATECDILMIDEPTRGIDVGAKQEIYKIMRALADSGKSIIMVSSEMPELIGMSDRIMVMRDGKIAGELYPEDYSQEAILNYASL